MLTGEAFLDRFKKTDRLMKIWLLIQKNPKRYTTQDLAEKFEVTVKTIYRDITSLGNEMNIPVRSENTRWIIDESHFLPPIRFTMAEALNIFLAARLMVSHNTRYDPHIDSTFSTLAAVLPSPLKEQVQNTVDWLHRFPKDEKYIATMARLGEAWISGRCVNIAYRAYDKEKAVERIVEPYFIEPVASGRASYLLAYCQKNKEIRTYKVDRIESIRITDQSYTIPADFNANDYLGDSLGIMVGGPVIAVKLKVKKELARVMLETPWHPSQENIKQKDGSLIVTLKVAESIELTRWVLRWGHYVEVLQPASLRAEVVSNAAIMLEQYNRK